MWIGLDCWPKLVKNTMTEKFRCPRCDFTSENMTAVGSHIREAHLGLDPIAWNPNKQPVIDDDDEDIDDESEQDEDIDSNGNHNLHRNFPRNTEEVTEWVLIPKYLTKEMVLAMETAYESAKDRNYDSIDGYQHHSYEYLRSDGYAEIWTAALNAAPKPKKDD